MTSRATYSIRTIAWALCLMTLLPAAAFADRKAELADRFASRLSELRQYKSAGKVGETTQGLVEVVSPADSGSDAKIKGLLAAENADRTELYGIIAKDQNTDASVVAGRAARRNYEKAQPGDFLKTATGEWKRK